MNSQRGSLLKHLCFLVFFLIDSAYALPPMNMPRGVTPLSHQIYTLHMATFYLCCAIGAGVFFFLFYSLIKFRKSKGAKAANFHEHLSIEILWTVIPLVIIVVMAVPATEVLFNIHNTERPDLNIKITGYQWKWSYDYLDQGVHFFSNLATTQDQMHNLAPKNPWYLLEVDHPLIVPVGEKIRFLVTANDVIHSWWVPELGIKQDAVPGYINETWALIEKPGIYRGQCAELCGAFHGFMPIVVQAVPKPEFEQWLRQQTQAGAGGVMALSAPAANTPVNKAQLVAFGKQVYEKTCAACHGQNGQGVPHVFPAIAGSKVATGPIDQQLRIVLNGVPGTAMQAFAAQLSEDEIAAVITYQRNAFGNATLVQQNKQKEWVTSQEVAKAKSIT